MPQVECRLILKKNLLEEQIAVTTPQKPVKKEGKKKKEKRNRKTKRTERRGEESRYGIHTLMTCGHHTIRERIGRKEAQLNLNSSDWMYSMGTADGVRANLAKANTTNLSGRHQLCQSPN
jgi:hypothetical protein